MKDIYFSLGSNLGDRLAHLRAGLCSLEKLGNQVSVSFIVETPSWGYEDPNSYLNLAAHFQMDISPNDLRLKIKEIERAAGRVSKKIGSETYEARTLDIDIIFYEDLILDTADLQLPHPRMQMRNFVLAPLANIAPNKVHPILNKSVAELLKISTDKSSITRFADGV